MYISITGLKPKGIISFFRFWRLAIPSFAQAQSAEGILFSQVKRKGGYQCTLTAWESRDHMLAFMRSGVHLKAMKAFHQIATGRTYGYESDSIPTWDNAYTDLMNKGKEYALPGIMKDNQPQQNGLAIGAAIGLALGFALSIKMGNPLRNMALGLAIGTAIGSLIDWKNRDH